MKVRKPGDFTGLAYDYSQNRPDYSTSVLNAMFGLLEKSVSDIDFVDVGAGTGIWSRMVTSKGVRTAIAIEPNDDMRSKGVESSKGFDIDWKQGFAENTGLQNASCDWVTMASSFHWANFEQTVAEFYRILKPNGLFSALWNPRYIEDNPVLVEIENYLNVLNPNIERVSSGRSGITETLTEKLLSSNYFEDVVYIEGRHVIRMTHERYLGAWRSVNDLQVQLGDDNFQKFIAYIEHRICELDFIDATYITRSWSTRRKERA